MTTQEAGSEAIAQTAEREQLAVDAVRMLAIDAVQRANSGHPGMPMGMADAAVVLWTRYLRVDPANPTWPDRDRFVLSAGHGSMLLYSLLHLSGFPLTIEDLRDFRQLGSPTPGHPEVDQVRGIETTTGPLGQGFGNGVGMAIAEAHLRDVFGSDLIDHRIFGIVSDGDLMEGVAAEAASLAGHLALGKIVYLYDDNEISLVGPTSLAFSEDVPARFAAYGWHTLTVDGHDRQAVAEAIGAGLAESSRPTLIAAKTHIGYGSPNRQDTAEAHGMPLGEEEVALVRERYGWAHPPFEVPSEVYEFFGSAMEKGSALRDAWMERRDRKFAADADVSETWRRYFDPRLVEIETPSYEPGTAVATRSMAGAVLNQVATQRADIIGGAADLASSTNTLITGSSDFSAGDRSGRNLRFGVREHAMGAVVNGITLHGGLRAYGATFLTFSDYMRGAVRLAALMQAPTVWVFTHDSVFLGEDGPTHQSIEHVAALRAIPNLWVIRPATPAETAGAWQLAINRTEGPTALILTRQGVPVSEAPGDPALVAKGGYVVRSGSDVVIAATGSELHVALEAAELLSGRGVSARVASLPCLEAFFAETPDHRRSVLGEHLPVVSVEAGTTFGWQRVTGRSGLNIGLDQFGASAPWTALAEVYGLTAAAVADRVESFLEQRDS